MSASESDFTRLERKVDRLTDAITQLVRVEERQLNHAQHLGLLDARVSKHEDRIDEVDQKVEKWVNRGIGIWALAATAWTIYMAFRGAGS